MKDDERLFYSPPPVMICTPQLRLLETPLPTWKKNALKPPKHLKHPAGHTLVFTVRGPNAPGSGAEPRKKRPRGVDAREQLAASEAQSSVRARHGLRTPASQPDPNARILHQNQLQHQQQILQRWQDSDRQMMPVPQPQLHMTD